MNEPAQIVFIFLTGFLLVVTTLLLPLGLEMDPVFITLLSAGLTIVVWTYIPEPAENESMK